VGWLSVAVLLLLPSLAAPGTPLISNGTACAAVHRTRLRGLEPLDTPPEEGVRHTPLFMDRPLEIYGVMHPAHLAHLGVDLIPPTRRSGD